MKNSRKLPNTNKEEILLQELEHLKNENLTLSALAVEHQRTLEELYIHQEELRAQNEELRTAQAEIKDSNRRYQDLFDFSPLGYLSLDRAGRILEVNLKAAQMLGRERGRLQGKPMLVHVAHESRDAFQSHLRRVFACSVNDLVSTQLRLIRHNNSRTQTMVQVESVHHQPATGAVSYCRMAILDISERKKVESDLVLASKVIDSMQEGLMITDEQGHIERVNEAFAQITGYQETVVLGKNAAQLYSGHHEPRFYKSLWRKLTREGRWSGEIWSKRKNGQVYPQWLTISRVQGTEGQTHHFVAVFNDISDMKAAERDLERLAHFDALTGLPNRVLLRDRITQALKHGHRHHTKVAILFLDLDNFKNVNDTCGHRAGDLLLQEAAKRLVDSVRDIDTVARIGGDEFVILLDDIGSTENAAEVAKKAIQCLEKPFQLNQREYYVGASVGIALSPDDAANVETLLRNADLAMYAAKEKGRHRYHVYTKALNHSAQRRNDIERDLRRALHSDEFTLHFQPQIDLYTGTVKRLEALARWQHPQQGLLLPEQFIVVAEQSGLIQPLGDLILELACLQLREWQSKILGSTSLAINISALQFRQSQIDANIIKMLEQYCISESLFEIEITESSAIHDLDRTFYVLNAWRERGIRVSIDDFGTGFSSLTYLKRFPIDTLKIDRSFVSNLNVSMEDKSLVEGIINIAHGLGLEVVAEGVEREDQRALLAAMSCDTVQGYLLAHPMPKVDLENWLRKRA